MLGNATDPLSYNGNAVNLVINSGGLMYENAGFCASLTTISVTGGTLSSGAGSGDGTATIP